MTDLNLGEMREFIEWLRPAIKALERGHALPESLTPSGKLAPWIQAIRNLEERRRESDAARRNLESGTRNRDAFVGQLTQQVHAAMEEVKVAQARAQQLQQELTVYNDMLAKVSEIAQKPGTMMVNPSSLAGEGMAKGSQICSLNRHNPTSLQSFLGLFSDILSEKECHHRLSHRTHEKEHGGWTFSRQFYVISQRKAPRTWPHSPVISIKREEGRSDQP
jgi:hypothetical protein